MTDSAKPTVILLFGDDELALEERLTDFIARLAEPANAEINLSRFSAARLDMETFETQLLAAPFLAPRRMVVLDLGTLTSRRLDFPERFFHLLETMPATSVVVALERVDFQALERRPRGSSTADAAQAHAAASPFYRWVRDHAGRAVARELRRPRGAAFERWAIERARHHGAEMDGKAAALLREYTGEETLLADQELRKLAAYVDGARPIGAADLERLTPFRAEGDVFAMVDSVGGRDGAKAMRTMQNLLAEEDPRYVFTMVVRQFRLLLLAREALDRGLAPRQVLTESPHRLPGFVADKVGRQALGFSLDQLTDVYRELLALDVASKSGRADITLGLETLVATLAG
jgi:DNA polymerase III subunit delta